ncbi:MAG: tripartite tricarboxylate transporter TctB family protein [Treponemataceae bacterium]
MSFVKNRLYLIVLAISSLFLIYTAQTSMTNNPRTQSFSYPRVIAYVLLFFTIVCLINEIRKKIVFNSTIPFTGLIAIPLYFIITANCGFLMATILFFPSAIYILGLKDKKKIVFLSIILTGVIFIIFRYGFKVPIPQGILW